VSVESYLAYLQSLRSTCMGCGIWNKLSKDDMDTISLIGLRDFGTDEYPNLWFTCRNKQCSVVKYNSGIGRFYIQLKNKITLVQMMGQTRTERDRPCDFEGSWY